MDVVKGVATLAVIGSALILGLTNPVTAIFSAIMLGVCLIAWLIDLFRPKPLSGPQLVALALTKMSPPLCSFTPPSGCFSADSTVRSAAGTPQPLLSLSLGDSVSTVTPEGRIETNQVHFFGHKDPSSLTVFFRVATASGHALSLTGDHLLPTALSPDTLWRDRTFKRARTVGPGDYIWVVQPGGAVALSAVQRVHSHMAVGLFNPYTESGATIVDDVVTSDHSAWLLDPLISDKYAWLAPILYAPLLQTGLAAVYKVSPGLVKAISECFYVTAAAGTSVADSLCAVQETWRWAMGQDRVSPASAGTLGL